jgi:xylan 1,4-beta-xylosidase
MATTYSTNAQYPRLVMRGDFPDPSVLRDGDDFYITCSSFDYYPGLVIWHSRDLIHWQEIGAALRQYVGAVWAPDLVKHGDRYYIYWAAVGAHRTIYVIWSEDIRGPWSSPTDLQIGGIDPGHIAASDGTRYLFLSNGWRATLSEDGLAATGELRKVYDGWCYPDEWQVETFALEGPKLFKRGEYFYMLSAQGGTAGPPTSHMVIAARARTLDGPWENCPHNPIVRTRSADEHWWSKGHGTLIEGVDGQWGIIYHAYENGFRTLGRQALIEPIEWTGDGWFTLSRSGPMARTWPRQLTAETSTAPKWQLYDSDERDRYRHDGDTLILAARGTRPADSSPLAFVTGDHAYEFEVRIDLDAETTAGVLLFYSRRLYAGLGFSADAFVLHNSGDDLWHPKPAGLGPRLYLRLRNDRHIVTMHYSADGAGWKKYDRVLEVSGYHHNVAYDFLSLRPAVYAAGSGLARFSQFRYRRLA